MLVQEPKTVAIHEQAGQACKSCPETDCAASCDAHADDRFDDPSHQQCMGRWIGKECPKGTAHVLRSTEHVVEGT